MRASTRLLEGFWSSAGRSGALRVRSARARAALLGSAPPGTLGRRVNRDKYQRPAYLDETFQSAYAMLEERAQTLSGRPGVNLGDLENPEVQFNFQFHDKRENDPRVIDYELPVYRILGERHWHSRDRMLLMQRLESLHAIPDTMPTLDPRVNVHIKFPFSTGTNRWVEPGTLLSSKATALPPVFKIQEYEQLNISAQRYTILVVNPDIPDLERDSYKTALCYGLSNIQIGYNDNLVDARKFNESQVLVKYSPPVPEKNAGVQRFCVWIFRQPLSSMIEWNDELWDKNHFDIRSFAKHFDLDPVGAHIWRSEWDLNVQNVRRQYGLPEGRVFTRVRK